MRRVRWVGCVVATGLAGCSVYPIPDDVSPFRTETIVRYARCEVKDAVLHHMRSSGLISPDAGPDNIRKMISDAKAKAKRIAQAEAKANAKAKPVAEDKAKAKKPPETLTDEETGLLRLTKVAVVYSFDFNITENNKAGAGAGLRLPWSANVLDVGGSTALDLTRIGSRVFGTEDSWDELMTNKKLCSEQGQPWQRQPNIGYPLTGSIGVGRVIETFIDIDLQEGAKDNFVDTLTFTTSISADANAGVKLDPVPNQFRFVSATAGVSASRRDVHKLTISLAFPQPDVPKGGVTPIARREGDLDAPFERPPAWRARYNLCVQDARTRESTFQQLRLTDPVVYCIAYADEFAPKYGNEVLKKTVVRTAKPKAAGPATGFLPQAAPGVLPGAAPPAQDTVTTTTTFRRRPNLRPMFQ